MKRIGLFCSGGDAPGMNAAIRAVARAAIFHGMEVVGIMRGYKGMIAGSFRPLDARSVSGIISHGGTILRTARCPEFLSYKGRKKAFEQLRKAGIEGLVAIGGDGTFRGAHRFTSEFDIPVIGITGSIDNDCFGTDYTLGFDTAVNIALDAIDRLRDTAASHDRIFFVEVMGRRSGAIALWSGLAGGAEAVFIPESRENLRAVARELVEGRRRGKTSAIVVVAEGEEAGGAFEIARKFKGLTGLDYRVTILGHIQRGGSPTAFDRILGTRSGVAAVEALRRGKKNLMVGVRDGKMVLVPFSRMWNRRKVPDLGWLGLVKMMSV
ncbi:MAG: 6-phosphofructokinase [Euryarchaeota archaeon]|nr:6-phosphofructokinase [Euryarchaeota archaeon]